ncbi:MAG: helix-turn-helix domain-containing protein [Crocinitomicaceae bacterium]
MSDTLHLKTITQAHQSLGLPKPKHPLVSVIWMKDVQSDVDFRGTKIVMNLYQIVLKPSDDCGNIQYGKNSYDYEEGTLVFTSPGQVISFEDGEASDANENSTEGWVLAFHPDLIRKSPLVEKISQYSFFDYEVHEALHLSDDERQTIEELLEKIVKEYSQNLDRHSQNLIVSNIELLLDYCSRFYDRQFYTRANLNSDVVSKFERLLKEYYTSEKLSEMGIPTVGYCAKELNLSSNYLSDMLKKETERSAQEHIHSFIIDKAKNSLLSTTESISGIGYGLGFEHPQHFSNLFKAKTGMSPRAYRQLN